MFLCVVSLGGYAQAATSKQRLNLLYQFFELNEAGYAYHRHCLSSSEGINDTFSETRDFVVKELIAEAVNQQLHANKESAGRKMLELQYELQYKLDRANMADGCYSKNSMVAREHYQEFSHMDKAEILMFIDQQAARR